MFRFLTSRKRHEPIVVTFYSKPGCHLCDDARALLEDLGTRYPVMIEEVDIRSDPALFRKYDIRIPVITFPDGTEMEAPLQPARVRAALRKGHGRQ